MDDDWVPAVEKAEKKFRSTIGSTYKKSATRTTFKYRRIVWRALYKSETRVSHKSRPRAGLFFLLHCLKISSYLLSLDLKCHTAAPNRIAVVTAEIAQYSQSASISVS